MHMPIFNRNGLLPGIIIMHDAGCFELGNQSDWLPLTLLASASRQALLARCVHCCDNCGSTHAHTHTHQELYYYCHNDVIKYY